MQQFSFNQKYYIDAYERLSKEDDRKEESGYVFPKENMHVD